MLTLTQLVTPLTSTQIRATLVQGLVNLNIPANTWRSGGVASTILTVVSLSLALASGLVATLTSGFFLPLATGDGLALLAQYVYGVTVPTATFATGFVVLTNTGGGIYTVGIGAYICTNPATGIQYANTSGFTLNASSSLSVPVAATTMGTVGNANPNTVTASVTPLLGVTVTNPSPITGLDAPSDASVRQLCLDSLGARSVRGPRTAYAYAVQTAVNSVTGNPVNINRETISESSHTGQITVWVASPAGVPDPNDVTGVANNIEATARPSAVRVSVVAATAVNYGPTITAFCTAPTGTSSAVLTAAAVAAVALFFQGYPIGGIASSDDTTSNISAVFASGVYAAIANALVANGATPISFQGGIDLSLASGAVAIDKVTVNVRILSGVSGTVVR